jgi:hypothetical protein
MLLPDSALPPRSGMSARLTAAVDAQRDAYAEWRAADTAWTDATSDAAVTRAAQLDADDAAARAERGDYSDPERSAVAEQQAAARAAARRAQVALDRLERASVTMVEVAAGDPAAPPAPATVAKMHKLLDGMRTLAVDLDATDDARRFAADLVAAYGRSTSALHRAARVGPVATALDALATVIGNENGSDE